MAEQTLSTDEHLVILRPELGGWKQLEAWQRTVLEAFGVLEATYNHLIGVVARPDELHILPSEPDRPRVAVDADCPQCGWPERFFDIRGRHFGCIKCPYTSDERNA